MSSLLAVYTSDPNLIRCELGRLGARVATGDVEANAAGIGSYAQDELLLERYAEGLSVEALLGKWSGPETEALIYHEQRLPLGSSREENTQPFRFRSWLFAHAGEVTGSARLRSAVWTSLPELLQRNIRGDTYGEAAFALFLKQLRDVGRADDAQVPPALVAQLLGRTIRALEQLSLEAGSPGRSTLNFATTQGGLLVAARYGPEPLYYTLLEGEGRCVRCGIEGSGTDAHPRIRQHLRARTVAVASRVGGKSKGWIELPHGTAIAVGRTLSVQTVPI